MFILVSSKDNHNEMIMTSLIGPQSGPVKGLCIFDKILILSLVKEIVLYTGKSPFEAPLHL